MHKLLHNFAKDVDVAVAVRRGNRLESGFSQSLFFFCPCESRGTTIPEHTSSEWQTKTRIRLWCSALFAAHEEHDVWLSFFVPFGLENPIAYEGISVRLDNILNGAHLFLGEKENVDLLFNARMFRKALLKIMYAGFSIISRLWRLGCYVWRDCFN